MRGKKKEKKKKEHPHTNHTRRISSPAVPPSQGLCLPARHSPRIDAAEAQPPLLQWHFHFPTGSFFAVRYTRSLPCLSVPSLPAGRSPPPPRGARPLERAVAASQRPAPVPARSPRPSEPFSLCSEWTRPRVSRLRFFFFPFLIYIFFNYFPQVHCLPVSASALPEGGGQGGCLGWRAPVELSATKNRSDSPLALNAQQKGNAENVIIIAPCDGGCNNTWYEVWSLTINGSVDASVSAPVL